MGIVKFGGGDNNWCSGCGVPTDQPCECGTGPFALPWKMSPGFCERFDAVSGRRLAYVEDDQGTIMFEVECTTAPMHGVEHQAATAEESTDAMARARGKVDATLRTLGWTLR